VSASPTGRRDLLVRDERRGVHASALHREQASQRVERARHLWRRLRLTLVEKTCDRVGVDASNSSFVPSLTSGMCEEYTFWPTER